MYAAYKAKIEELERMAEAPAEKGYKRHLLLAADLGVEADFAFKYYCENVKKEGDFLTILYCPSVDHLQKIQNEALMNETGVSSRLGQLVLDESHRFMKDAKQLEERLRLRKIDGTVQIGTTGIFPGENIVETAKREAVTMIILGARRLGQALREQRSTKKHVIRNSTVPLLVCKRAEWVKTDRKTKSGAKRLVLAGSDGMTQASDALIFYKDKLYSDGDYLLLVYIPKEREVYARALPAPSSPDLQKELQALHADTAAHLRDLIRDELKMPGDVMIGQPNENPADALLKIAEDEGADLIVVGSHGLSPHTYEASTRTSEKLVHDSKVSVFVKKY